MPDYPILQQNKPIGTLSGGALATVQLLKLMLTKARIYFSGQNLLTLKSSSLTCSDPENPNWNYPLAASLSFGLQVGF